MPDFKLSAQEHQAIFESLEVKILSQTASVENPRIVIIGGQPGAGKSNLIDLARSSFAAENVAVINGDDYRQWHPQNEKIFAEDEKRYAEHTDPDVRIWTKNLFDSAIMHRRNIIFEGTMRNSAPIMETIEKLKKNGYRVEISVMAVSERVSKAGIIARYESQKEAKGYGRWVNFEIHDEAYLKMPETAEKLERHSPVDEVNVYNRALALLYSNRKNSKGEWGHSPAVREAILLERSISEKRDIPDFETLLKKMRSRQASEEEMQSVKEFLETRLNLTILVVESVP